jgi:hypothetical protein
MKKKLIEALPQKREKSLHLEFISLELYVCICYSNCNNNNDNGLNNLYCIGRYIKKYTNFVIVISVDIQSLNSKTIMLKIRKISSQTGNTRD